MLKKPNKSLQHSIYISVPVLFLLSLSFHLQAMWSFFKDTILGEEYPFLGSTCFDILGKKLLKLKKKLALPFR
jgi:hypothetical protein